MKQNDKTYSRIFALAFITVTVFAFILYFVPEKQPLNWLSYEDALIVSAKKNKPLLLNFYSIWNEDCKRLDRDIFSNESLKNKLKTKHILSRIILDNKQNSKIAREQYHIQGIPAIIELTPNGQESRRLTTINEQSLYILMNDPAYKILSSWQKYQTAKNEADSNNKIFMLLLNTGYLPFNFRSEIFNDDKVKLLIAQDFVPAYLVASNTGDMKIIKSLFGGIDNAPFGYVILFYYQGNEIDRYFLSQELVYKQDELYNKMLDVIKKKAIK